MIEVKLTFSVLETIEEVPAYKKFSDMPHVDASFEMLITMISDGLGVVVFLG